MERLSGCCAAKAGMEKDKKKSKKATIGELLIMVENVALLGVKIVLKVQYRQRLWVRSLY